jgi:hypothetical protein
MTNKYLSYISDDHLLKCISNLHQSYLKAKNKLGKREFYANKVDSIKLTFDSKFNDLTEEDLIQTEVLRQIDKSINNFLGTFHEEILGGVIGFERGNLSGYDIKAQDDSLFADIKNKHNTMNSSSAESLFQKLKNYADKYKKANCYWVQILAKGSFNTHWKGDINGKEYSHSRVYKISGDQFYKLVTKQDDAFLQLYKILPKAIDDYLKSLDSKEEVAPNSALSEIKEAVKESGRTFFDQIIFDNFRYYEGFDKL